MPSTAGATTVTGATTATYADSVSLTVQFDDDHWIGCGTGDGQCAGWIFEFDENDESLGVYQPCGRAPENPNPACETVIYGHYYRNKVDDPTTQSAVAHFRACNGDGTGCVDHWITWTPDTGGGGGDDGGGDGDGGSGGGGTGGGNGSVPTAVLEGASSYQIPDDPSPMLSVSASAPSTIPYQLAVFDQTDGSRLVGGCSTSGSSCEFGVYPDVGAKEPVVHHLVSETQFAGLKVADGDTKDVTVNPFPTKAKIQLRNLRPADPGVASAGVATFLIANIDKTYVPGYSVSLQVRDPAAAQPKWKTVGACQQYEPLECEIEYTAPDHPNPSQPLALQFRSVVRYLDEVRDVKVLPVSFFHGVDWNSVLLVIAAKGAQETCEKIYEYNNWGPRFGGESSLNNPSAICAAATAGIGAAAIAATLTLMQENPDAIGQIFADMLRSIQNVTVPVSIPSGGGSSGGTITTTGQAVYDQAILDIANSLRRLNRGIAELDLTTAKAVAAACLATSAYRGISGAIGAAMGPSFCMRPTMPMFIVGANLNEAAQHDFDAIFGHVGKGIAPHPEWAVLNYSSTAIKRSAGQNPRWYRYNVACKKPLSGEGTGKDCDEYPYFSTQQGGSAAPITPSLRPIDSDENTAEGRLLYQTLYNRCGLQSATGITATSNGTGGSRYLVLPMPRPGLSNVPSLFWKPILDFAPLTFGICNRPRQTGGGAPAS